MGEEKRKMMAILEALQSPSSGAFVGGGFQSDDEDEEGGMRSAHSDLDLSAAGDEAPMDSGMFSSKSEPNLSAAIDAEEKQKQDLISKMASLTGDPYIPSDEEADPGGGAESPPPEEDKKKKKKKKSFLNLSFNKKRLKKKKDKDGGDEEEAKPTIVSKALFPGGNADMSMLQHKNTEMERQNEKLLFEINNYKATGMSSENHAEMNGLRAEVKAKEREINELKNKLEDEILSGISGNEVEVLREDRRKLNIELEKIKNENRNLRERSGRTDEFEVSSTTTSSE